MYVRVYSPEGEPFEVTRDRADRLILQNGWTQTRPTPVSEDEEPEAPRKRRRKADEANVDLDI